MTGRVPSEPGSSPTGQAPAGLVAARVDPSRWEGRVIIRCMGGSSCNHAKDSCTASPEYQRYAASLREARQPAYTPAHKLPVWLSSVDVHAAIRELADAGADKAACWDFTQAIYRLTERAHGTDGGAK